jgi:hypothetical protein
MLESKMPSAPPRFLIRVCGGLPSRESGVGFKASKP